MYEVIISTIHMFSRLNLTKGLFCLTSFVLNSVLRQNLPVTLSFSLVVSNNEINIPIEYVFLYLVTHSGSNVICTTKHPLFNHFHNIYIIL